MKVMIETHHDTVSEGRFWPWNADSYQTMTCATCKHRLVIDFGPRIVCIAGYGHKITDDHFCAAWEAMHPAPELTVNDAPLKIDWRYPTEPAQEARKC